MAAKRAKRFLRVLVWFVVVMALVLVAFPFWFPWVLRPAAQRFGATYQSYQRLSYSRFAVSDAGYSNRNVRVSAKRLEISLRQRAAKADDWSVIVSKDSGRVSTNRPASVHAIYTKVSKIVSNVQHWVPQAALTNGFVQTPNVTVHIPEVRWAGENLEGLAGISNALPATVVRAKLPTSAPVQIDLSVPKWNFASVLTVSNTSQGVFIAGFSDWRTNRISLDVAFGKEGALPERAEAIAKSVAVAHARGDVTFRWEKDRYVLHASGEILKQPLTFALRATGDLKAAAIESAQLSAPWASAQLEEHLPIQYTPPFLQSNASLVLTADLAKQPWFPASGKVIGRVVLHPDALAEFSLSGRDVRAAKVHATLVETTGSLSLSNLTHQGTVNAQGPSIPKVSLRWTGEKLDLKELEAKLTAKDTSISMRGAANLKEKHFRVSDLALGTNQIDFAADVRWPQRASLRAGVTNLVSRSYGRHVVVDYLRLSVLWDNGPITGEADFGARTIKDGSEIGAQGAIAARGEAISITNMVLMHNSSAVGTVHGVLPIAIVPTDKRIVVPQADEPMHLEVTGHPNAFFWKLAREEGVTVREPDLRAEITGTWKEPKGRLSLRASQLKFRDAPPEVPPIEHLSVLAHVRANVAEIEFLNFFITNQPVTFSARMPLPAGFWNAPHSNAVQLDWRDLSCRLQIDSAQIAAFAPLLPRMVIPQGAVHADVGLAPGGKLNGHLRIDGGATRPIPSLGALQDIEILCRFAEDRAHVNSHVALGGYTVFGAGQAQLDANRLLRGEPPPFEFHLTGENVPLVRQVDAVVRADLDATFKHQPNQPLMISGKLNLRDSLYLRELRDLVPGRLASAERRPPYLSITAEPFADWRLDIAARGHRFLKVRTPIFNGELSADLRLSGTLADPVAIGDLTLNAGIVRFPFGNIPINQGSISLPSDNPYRPQLLITGNQRILNYDVNMEVSGYADAPVLQFNSTPPLSSEQILLMLTAGEIPRQGQFAFTTEERAQRVALFVGRGVLADFGLGGDSNRLTIRSGENVSDTGRPTYSVEYELTDDWSLLGQYDQFNDFNLMLKWRVYSK